MSRTKARITPAAKEGPGVYRGSVACARTPSPQQRTYAEKPGPVPGFVVYGAAMKIGLISDTHGLLRPRTLEVLAGCGLILHGGDIGGPKIL